MVGSEEVGEGGLAVGTMRGFTDESTGREFLKKS
jgi:hypothetical protein